MIIPYKVVVSDLLRKSKNWLVPALPKLMRLRRR